MSNRGMAQGMGDMAQGAASKAMGLKKGLAAGAITFAIIAVIFIIFAINLLKDKIACSLDSFGIDPPDFLGGKPSEAQCEEDE